MRVCPIEQSGSRAVFGPLEEFTFAIWFLFPVILVLFIFKSAFKNIIKSYFYEYFLFYFSINME